MSAPRRVTTPPPMTRWRTHPHGRRHGFTLVEVLIALVVMSVGMLGIAGLYLHSIQAGRTSIFRHHAITLAGDVADRIRANPSAGISYQGAGQDNGCIGGAIDCTPIEMAQTDIAVWAAQASSSLPDGRVGVIFSENGGPAPNEYRITVSWNEPGMTPAPSYTVEIPVNDFTAP